MKPKSDNLLMIFVRNPELGKVKTRLAKTVGDEMALEVYLTLLEHTRKITEDLAADKMVFYNGYINEEDLFEQHKFDKALQNEGDLGHKMLKAFEYAFTLGYKHVSIIGSDCYELTTPVLTDAFENLKQEDVVIGPAKDGGYYLIGMNTLHHQLFENKRWSTENVILDTMLDLKELNLSYALLPTLSDVDHEEDLGDLGLALNK